MIPAAIAGLLFLVQSDLVARTAARAIEAAAEEAIGERVAIGRIEVSYLPPHVEVQGIEVTHPATSERVAAARTVRLQPGLDGWRPVLQKLELESPELALHLDADGLREFRGVKTATEKTADTFPWKELWITDGRFSFTGAGVTVAIEDVDARPAADPARTDLAVASVAVVAGDFEQRAADIHFPGLTLAPDRVVVPAFFLDFDALRVEGHAAAVRDGPLNADVSLRLDLARVTRDPGNPRYVDGAVHVDAELRGTTAAPELGGALAWTDFVIWSGEPVSATRIGDANGRWALRNGPPVEIVVDPLTVAWGDGEVLAKAVVDPEAGTIAGEALAEDVSLARILQEIGAAPTPWVDLRGDVETHVAGTIEPLEFRGPFEVNVARFVVNDGPVQSPSSARMLGPLAGTVQGQLYFDADHLVLDADRVVSERSAGRARASIPFDKKGDLSVDVRFPVVDLAQLAPLGDAGLAGLARVEGWIGGPYTDLTARADIDVAGAVVLGLPIADRLTARLESPDMERLSFSEIRASRGRTDYRGDFEIAFTDPMWIDTQVYVADGWVSDVAGVWVDLGGADARMTAQAALSGEPYHLDGEVSVDLRDADVYGEHFPIGHATAWMDDGELTVEGLALRRDEETVLARGSVKRGFRMNVEVLWDGATLERLDSLAPLALPLTGDLVLDARIGGTLTDPEPRGRLATRDVFYAGARMGDSRVDFETHDGVLAWDGKLVGDTLATKGTLGLWGEQPYQLSAKLDEFPAHVFYAVGADGSPITATLTGSVDLAGRFGDNPTPADAVVRIDHAVASWSGHTLSNPAPWHIDVHGKRIDIPTIRLEGNDGTALSFSGHASAREVSFAGEGKVDLDLARAVVPELQTARGYGDVALAIDDAGARATLDLRDATLRTGYFPAEFEGLRAHVDASADGYRIRDVSAQVGGGRFKGEPSTIEAEGWIPRRYALAGALRDVEVQYLDWLPPVRGDAELAFDGPVGELLLSGRVRVDDMVFRDRVDWEAMVLSLREERLTGAAPVETEKYFAFDLAIAADQTVHLRNNVADAEASADLRIVGDTSRVGMVGTIEVEPGGRVYLHEREFEVLRGELRYLDPYTYDPLLDILLTTDLTSREQDYRITYQVSGPFSDWRTTTTSDPWLAQADINALLLFGVTREELERYGGLGTALVAETGDLLLQQTALTRLDLVVIDRWNLVSGVSERGSNVLSSELRLVAEKQWNGFDFTVEKSLSSGLDADWYASVERRLTDRFFATAYVATRQEGRSLPIGAAYGAELKFRLDVD
ncbi:MAG: translocation/assembly module TamB domain-containing protein [Myxococcota bacterium]